MSDRIEKGLEKELMCLHSEEFFGRVLCNRPNMKCKYISSGMGYESEPVHICTKYESSSSYQRNLNIFGIMLNLGSDLILGADNVKKIEGEYDIKVSSNIYNKGNSNRNN